MRVVHNSLHEQVADTLRQEIFSGTLAPGSFVDEVALCERLAISRTPLREALKVLTAEGLVRHEPRRGCFVKHPFAKAAVAVRASAISVIFTHERMGK